MGFDSGSVNERTPRVCCEICGHNRVLSLPLPNKLWSSIAKVTAREHQTHTAYMAQDTSTSTPTQNRPVCSGTTVFLLPDTILNGIRAPCS
jgi:hypothetical protein